MKGKTKLAGKALSLLLSLIMVLTAAGFNLGFSAFATVEQEVNFCVDKMKNLPTDDEFLEEMLKTLPEDDPNKSQANGENTAQEKKEKFNTKRSDTIVHSDGKTEEVKFNEEEVYKEIQDLVIKLTQEFQGGQAAENILNFQKQITQTNESKTSRDHSRNLQKADAIYRWVAENIDYDFESYDAGESDRTKAVRKPQDAYFVFHKKMGVCAGYACLTNLMMRMAGVPCMYVGSINGPNSDYGHAFNAVYIEDENNKERKGWTLLDSCWASPGGSDGDEEIKKFLSGENFPNDCSIYDEGASYSLKNILLREDEGDKYLHEVFDKIFKYLKNNDPTNPSQELVDALNKQVSDTLKQANENHKYGTHLEKIEFFIKTYSPGIQELQFKYETDRTAQQAKQAKAKYKELQESRDLKSTIDLITGKTVSCVVHDMSDKILDELTGEEFDGVNDISALNALYSINDGNYCDDLQQTLANVMSSKLDYIKKQIGNLNSELDNQLKELEDINSELNDNLKELNEKYSDVITFKQVELFLKSTAAGCVIVGKFDTGLSEEEIKKLYSEQGKQDEDEYKEFFPAFYNKNQSLEDANREIINHDTHKVSTFKTIGFWKDKYRIINDLKLDESSHEGKAKIIVNDRDNEGQTKNLITDKLFEYGLPICVNVFFDPLDKLVLKGDMSIIAGWDTKIKEIDAKDSSKYILENGVLYERTNLGGKEEKKAILQFYDEAYRTIEYVDTQKAIQAIQDGTLVP